MNLTSHELKESFDKNEESGGNNSYKLTVGEQKKVKVERITPPQGAFLVCEKSCSHYKFCSKKKAELPCQIELCLFRKVTKGLLSDLKSSVVDLNQHSIQTITDIGMLSVIIERAYRELAAEGLLLEEDVRHQESTSGISQEKRVLKANPLIHSVERLIDSKRKSLKEMAKIINGRADVSDGEESLEAALMCLLEKSKESILCSIE